MIDTKNSVLLGDDLLGDLLGNLLDDLLGNLLDGLLDSLGLGSSGGLLGRSSSSHDLGLGDGSGGSLLGGSLTSGELNLASTLVDGLFSFLQ